MLAKVFILIVSFLHFYFLVLEMFLWTKPLGMKTFRLSREQALATQSLAANQGLYNGFLAAGLLWACLHPDPQFGQQLAIYFLACVIVAALYGAYSVSRRILFVQGLPAVLALGLALFFGL